jgi:predicted cupin superfamily sugar epimerase
VDSRAAHLISVLRLEPHPEGGFYRQTYRSGSTVQPADERTTRASLTTIYFLLPGGEVSRWHAVSSDEVWHFYEGAPLELFTADREFAALSRQTLGPVGADSEPVHVVAAHAWQAARSTGSYTLVGCTVGPGFEFADFRMLRDTPPLSAVVRERRPDAAPFI